MSIDITYFVLDILQVVISRSPYYISFERMCLTVDSCTITLKEWFSTNGMCQNLMCWPKCVNFMQSGPEVIKLFSCSTQLSMKFIMLINVKMPTTVDILIFLA